MPKRTTEAYESDDGFVEDAPSSKKSRVSTVNQIKRKEGKQAVDSAMHEDDEGNPYWELSAQRRVTVSDFKGKQMVHLREYYEKDGKTLPGKKGISLPLDQFSAFIAVLPQIEEQLAERGVDVPRPAYDRERAAVNEDDDDGDSDADTRTKARTKKLNIEETSDEDED